MEKNNKKVLFFDIDGTIFDYKRGIIPNSTIEGFKKLKENGYTLTIATGRCFAQLGILEPIKEYIDYYILANGEHIINKDNGLVFESPFTKSELKKLVDSFKKYDLGYGLQGETLEIINENRKDVIDVIEYCKLPYPVVYKDFHISNKVYQAWVVDNIKCIENLRKENPDLVFVPWLDNAYDIMRKDASKGEAAKFLIEKFGFIYSYGFGDNYNDLPLLDVVDEAILIKSERIKDVPKKYFLADEIDKDGLYKALEIFKLI